VQNSRRRRSRRCATPAGSGERIEIITINILIDCIFKLLTRIFMCALVTSKHAAATRCPVVDPEHRCPARQLLAMDEETQGLPRSKFAALQAVSRVAGPSASAGQGMRLWKRRPCRANLMAPMLQCIPRSPPVQVCRLSVLLCGVPMRSYSDMT
jgi:hypothetical protein